MEESKAAAYYDELTRKGEGAAKFKQGLGFNSTIDSDIPDKPSSSYLGSFVKSSHTNSLSDQSQLHTIRNKLSKKNPTSNPNHHHQQSQSIRVSDTHSRRRSRSRDLEQSRVSDNHSRRRSRSRDRSSRNAYRSSSRERHRRRSMSPVRRNGRSERSGKVDYSRLIDGYDKMSPAERVKAKMKLQLTETVEKDATKGMGSGWERFEFNKDAPLDDEETEVAEDDAKLVKHIGQSFRFSAVEARKEEKIKDAHDMAMFGVPAAQISPTTDHILEENNNKTESNKTDMPSLASEKVLAKQQGSWRDRVRKM